jgi:hypothetical protein
VVHSSAGADETAMIAAAQAQGHSADGGYRGAASASPGVGWAPQLPDSPISAGELRGQPGEPALPAVVGEGYAVGVPAQPAQVQADAGTLVHGRTPDYAGEDVAGAAHHHPAG